MATAYEAKPTWPSELLRYRLSIDRVIPLWVWDIAETDNETGESPEHFPGNANYFNGVYVPSYCYCCHRWYWSWPECSCYVGWTCWRCDLKVRRLAVGV